MTLKGSYIGWGWQSWCYNINFIVCAVEWKRLLALFLLWQMNEMMFVFFARSKKITMLLYNMLTLCFFLGDPIIRLKRKKKDGENKLAS